LSNQSGKTSTSGAKTSGTTLEYRLELILVITKCGTDNVLLTPRSANTASISLETNGRFYSTERQRGGKTMHDHLTYCVWPDGTYVAELDYVEGNKLGTEWTHMSDDWFILELPDSLTDEEIEAAVQQAINGTYSNA